MLSIWFYWENLPDSWRTRKSSYRGVHRYVFLVVAAMKIISFIYIYIYICIYIYIFTSMVAYSTPATESPATLTSTVIVTSPATTTSLILTTTPSKVRSYLIIIILEYQPVIWQILYYAYNYKFRLSLIPRLTYIKRYRRRHNCSSIMRWTLWSSRFYLRR